MWTPAGPWKSFDRFFVSGLLHGGDVLLLVVSHEGVQGGAAFVFLFIELVYDDADKEVESKETSEHNEGHEKTVADETVFKSGLDV